MDAVGRRMEAVNGSRRVKGCGIEWEYRAEPARSDPGVEAAVPDVLLTAPAQAPARRRVALGAPLLVVFSFVVAAPLSELLAAVDGRHGTAGGAAGGVALGIAVLGAAALAVGWFGRPLASVVIGPVFWLFFDAFVVNRSGSLGWDGGRDALGLAVLLGAGLAGGLMGALTPWLRDSGTRLRAAVTGRFGRASLEPFSPVAPPPGYSWYWN
jgi:hypothetical protein